MLLTFDEVFLTSNCTSKQVYCTQVYKYTVQVFLFGGRGRGGGGGKISTVRQKFLVNKLKNLLSSLLLKNTFYLGMMKKMAKQLLIFDGDKTEKKKFHSSQ